MKYVFIILIVVILFFILYMILKHKKNNMIPMEEKEAKKILLENEKYEISPIVEILPIATDRKIDDYKLVKITDKNVLDKIDHIVIESAKTSNAIKNTMKSSKNLYEIILPKGEKLVNVKGSSTKFRSFYKDKQHIKGHAEIVKVNNMKISNLAASTMSVASLVVGQYYMEKINQEMNKISKNVEKISDFQIHEYKSKIFALIEQVKKIIQFKSEVIDNEELRKQTVAQLKNLEHECIQLLGHATSTLKGKLKENPTKYEEYEEELNEIQEWYIYQVTLYEILEQIAELSYILNIGNESREQSNYLLNAYFSQLEHTKVLLKNWNNNHIKRYGININEKHRNREKFDKIIHQIPSIWNEKYKYKELNPEIVNMIEAQINGDIPKWKNKSDYFDEDVHIISKNGELYYLTNENH